MDAALVGSIFAGLIGVLGAVSNYLLSRQKANLRDLDELGDEVDELRGRLETAMAYIHTLRLELSGAGVSPTPIPDELAIRRRKHGA